MVSVGAIRTSRIAPTPRKEIKKHQAMTCYSPLVKAETNERYETKIDGSKMKKAIIIKPDDNHENLESFMHTHPTWNYTVIPCKKCIGCRLDYSREWANRGYLESLNWTQNYFVTLTYDDEHLPEGETLEPKEFSNFIKRLRKYMRDKKIQSKGIRFMGCGEYGEERGRPHYHVILFNCKLPTDSFYNPRISNKNTYWQNEIIEKCWNKGIINVSDVTWNTIAYTARYITKKIYGAKAEEEYQGKVPEFFRTSRNPGIGGYYYDEHASEIYENDEIIITNKKGAASQKPPKYFDRLLDRDNPELLENLKRTRRKRASDNARVLDEQSSYTRLERLAINARSKADKMLALIRELEKKK